MRPPKDRPVKTTITPFNGLPKEDGWYLAKRVEAPEHELPKPVRVGWLTSEERLVVWQFADERPWNLQSWVFIAEINIALAADSKAEFFV